MYMKPMSPRLRGNVIPGGRGRVSFLEHSWHTEFTVHCLSRVSSRVKSQPMFRPIRFEQPKQFLQNRIFRVPFRVPYDAVNKQPVFIMTKLQLQSPEPFH